MSVKHFQLYHSILDHIAHSVAHTKSWNFPRNFDATRKPVAQTIAHPFSLSLHVKRHLVHWLRSTFKCCPLNIEGTWRGKTVETQNGMQHRSWICIVCVKNFVHVQSVISAIKGSPAVNARCSCHCCSCNGSSKFQPSLLQPSSSYINIWQQLACRYLFSVVPSLFALVSATISNGTVARQSAHEFRCKQSRERI